MCRKIFIPLLLAFAALVSCSDEQDASQVYVRTVASSMKVNSGEVMYFDIFAETVHNALVELKAELFDPDSGSKLVMDEKPGTRTFKKRLEFEVPMVREDGTKMEMYFSVKDDAGNIYSKSDYFIVDRGEGRKLEEASSIVLQSPATGCKDAFSLVKRQVVDAGNAEKRDLDIIFAHNPEGEELPSDWTTGTNVVFAKAPSFDYSAATAFSVKAVLENSVTSNVLRGIAMDDIILVGREILVEDQPGRPEDPEKPQPENPQPVKEGTKALDATPEVRLEACGVIRILAVIDVGGVEGDRMIFSYKYI